MRRNMKIVVGGAAVVLMAVVAWLVWPSSKPAAPAPAVKERPVKAKRIADVKARRAKAKADRLARPKPAKRPVRVVAVEDEHPMTPEEQKLYDAIQDALDVEDYGKICELAATAAQLTNEEVRLQAVEALNWFGQKALPELTMFMADASDEVRNQACDAWRTGVSEIEDPGRRGNLTLSAMQLVRDRDQLDFMVMEISDLSDKEQIGILEKLIGGGNTSADAVAREHYEFVTGEKYESHEAAQRWLDENKDE